MAHIEQNIREDFTERLAVARDDFGLRLSEQTDQFDETLKGLRQKINDVELNGVKNFVAKPDFDDFRKEYREDMRDLKTSIATIPRSKQ